MRAVAFAEEGESYRAVLEVMRSQVDVKCTLDDGDSHLTQRARVVRRRQHALKSARLKCREEAVACFHFVANSDETLGSQAPLSRF